MDLVARIKTGFLIIAAVFLVAFTLWWLMPGNDSEARWEDYLSRLARLSQQAVPERAPLPIVPYLGNRELHQPIPEHRVDMLDYLELRHCNLMSLISERNSVLGKLQADSLRFKHEVTFIRRARQCLASDKLDNQALITLLEQVVTEKQAALPALYWNALVASAEFRQFFSQSPSAMAGDSQAALLSLEQLAQSPFQGETLPSPEQLFRLEARLQQIAHSQAGGQLLRRLALALRELERGNTLLENIDPVALCPKGRPTPRARKLRNVLDNIWGSQVQQALADAQRQRKQLANALTKIEALLAPTPPAFAQWQDHYFSDTGLQSQLNRALKHHVSLWQERLRQCNLMPDGGQKLNDSANIDLEG